MPRWMVVVLLASGCSLYFGEGVTIGGGDDGGYHDVWIDTCGGEPQPEDTCTPGDSCEYESWEHGCTCGCDETGHWACFNETIGSHCATGEYGEFFAAVRIDAVSTPADERAPAIAADGSELVFARGGDLFRARAAAGGGGFEAATRDAELSTAAAESDPALAGDGTIYFTRDGVTRDAAGPVPELAGFAGADFARPGDLALVAAAQGEVVEFSRPDAAMPWTPGLRVTGAASPTMRIDGLELIFEGTRDGKRALFEARRWQRDAPWDVVRPLVIAGMDGANVGDPELSADGLTLYVSSDAGGDFDIYASTRYRM